MSVSQYPVLPTPHGKSVVKTTAKSHRHSRTQFVVATAFLLILLAALHMQRAQAASIYKCVDSAGNTTYTGSPCAEDESASRISSSASAAPALSCRIARQLAITTAGRMKNGEPSGAVYDSYGGMDNLSPLSVGLISYVYTFNGNDTISDVRIAALTTDRCQVGAFGSAADSCDVYPLGFINELGGCAAALSTGGVQQVAANNLPQQTSPGTAAYAPPALGKASPTSASRSANVAAEQLASDGAESAQTLDASAQCKQRLAQSIERTAKEMLNAQSAQSQDALRARQRQLRSQQNRC